ncbi:MAG: bifunctional phosphoribosylaminoimidazolecarboxamide formyltransferase/IMP cyclohydrolase [Candidatus Puniceispirillales bacterium WSBS_2018_MAG_OTU23]
MVIKRALLSVSDKFGIEDFARQLIQHGVEVVSTGGTAKLLKDAGLDVIAVADVTGAAEMMDGRVKTLNPKIHGGILARRDNDQHNADMKRCGITPIDLVVVNLYPFGKTLKRPDANRDDLVENIDIGGPAMIRAAAKNHDFVTIITDIADYAPVLAEITAEGFVAAATRRKLATKAFAHTAHYDSTIAGWMRGEIDDVPSHVLPTELSFSGVRRAMMRYGENPHQEAAVYEIASQTTRAGVLTAEQLQGKPLSFNNINDTDSAFELVAEFTAPTIAIIKHANPCGVASHDDLGQAWDAALASDPVSAFGGIIALNRPLTAALAAKITSIFTEVVIAPSAEAEAKAIMAAKPNLRLLLTHTMLDAAEKGLVFRSIAGGFLAQTRDIESPSMAADFRCVTTAAPTEAEQADMVFAMTVAKHVKSNAIVYAKGGATVGIGAGQMSRLDSSRIAIKKADDLAKNNGFSQSPIIGSVVASDAFFPFADGLLAAANAGVTAVIQPGGSVNDDAIIAAANDAGLAMIFTSMRHFRH